MPMRRRQAGLVSPGATLGEWLADPAIAEVGGLARSADALSATWATCTDGRVLLAVVLELAARTREPWHWQLKTWDLLGWTYDRAALEAGRYHDLVMSIDATHDVDPKDVDADTVRCAIDIDELIASMRS